jgi:hypothetical protein
MRCHAMEAGSQTRRRVLLFDVMVRSAPSSLQSTTACRCDLQCNTTNLVLFCDGRIALSELHVHNSNNCQEIQHCTSDCCLALPARSHVLRIMSEQAMYRRSYRYLHISEVVTDDMFLIVRASGVPECNSFGSNRHLLEQASTLRGWHKCTHPTCFNHRLMLFWCHVLDHICIHIFTSMTEIESNSMHHVP